MLRAIVFKRTSRSLYSLLRAIQKRTVTDLNAVAMEKKKKKLSEQTAQEIEAELRGNLVNLKKTIEKDESEDVAVPIFKKSLLHIDQVAIKDLSGEYTYLRLFLSAKRLAMQISNLCGSASQKNVGYLCSNNILSPLAQWSCWMSGQVAVPMNMCSSPDVLHALLKDAKSSLLIVTPEYEQLGNELTQKLDIPLLTIDPSFIVPENTTLASEPRLLIGTQDNVMIGGTFTNDFYNNANAMLLYTPGTAGRPKGVMISHRNLNSQVRSLVQAWKFNSNDCFMHALPLNNALGAVNAFLSVMSVGGRIVMQSDSSSHNVWSTLLGINKPAKERVNVFMAVPAVYNALLVEYEKSLAKNIKMVEYISNYFKENVRLMTSYSAPLPPTIFRRWREVTGHSVVESYGSTECGLVMSNKYMEAGVNAEDKRQPGLVGLPMPDVRVRLIGSQGEVLIDCLGEYENGECIHHFLSNEETDCTQEKDEQNQKLKVATTGEKKLMNYTMASLAESLYAYVRKWISSLLQFNIITERSVQVLQNDKINVVFDKKRITTEAYLDESIKMPENVSEGLFSQPLNVAEEQPCTTSTAKLPNTTRMVPTENQPPIEFVLGELEISGPQVFSSYYGNRLSTDLAFKDGFYKTGDIATYQNGVFKVLGRSNIDVIEIGGKKISSYDIESVLLQHPSIRDVSVVTIPQDATYDKTGIYKPAESIGVICVLNEGAQLDLESLNEFCFKSLPQYLSPRKLQIVDELPRSNMAVINKHELKRILSEPEVVKAQMVNESS